MSRAHATSLKRALGLGEATFYGVGIIIGAGIYAIIGAGAGEAGNGLWLSFAIAAVIAALTGLSYAELSSRLPKEAAEYHYTKRAFDKRTLAFTVGWVMVVANLIAAATVSLGFAGYFHSLFSTPLVPTAAALVLFMGVINFIGIKESARFNILATLIEAGGLVVVIALGAPHFATYDFSIPIASLAGVLPAAALIFFAYIGFEDVANISEETRNARKVIPKALLIALAVSTVFYILTSLAALALIGPAALASSKAPLADAVAVAIGPTAGTMLSLTALFATCNTALFMLIVSSRMLYGIARGGDLPRALARIHAKRRTPSIAVLVTTLAVLGLVAIGDLKTVASLADVGIFIGYFFVNMALIGLRLHGSPHAGFRVPFSVGRLPVLPVLGAISIFALGLHFDPLILAAEGLVVGLGILVHLAYRRSHPPLVERLTRKRAR